MVSYKFFWRRVPRLREYAEPVVTTAIAAFLLSIAISPIVTSSDPQRGLAGQYGLLILAILSGIVPAFLWCQILGRRYQFIHGIAPLKVGPCGITAKDWYGRDLVLSWKDLIFERVQHNARDDLLFRAGKISGSLSLLDLDRNPDDIADIIKQCSSYAASGGPS